MVISQNSQLSLKEMPRIQITEYKETILNAVVQCRKCLWVTFSLHVIGAYLDTSLT